MAITAKLTAAGIAKQSSFLLGGTAAQITHFAIGDGNGSAVTLPNPPTGLVNEVYRSTINRVYYSSGVPIVEMTVPIAVGGFVQRELALIDSTDAIVAVAVLPESNKPLPATGSSKLSIFNVSVEVTSAAFITELVLDSSAVIPTRAYVDSTFATQSAVAAALAVLMPTGSEWGYWGTTAPAGFVMASGRTIGNAASGGTERANADTEALFTLLWNSTAQTEFPIQTSAGGASTRGASAAADFAANKRMPLPDLRGRTGIGKDDMGGTAASRMNVTLTGTRASTSTGVITGLSSTTGLSVGMVAIGTGIAAGATILSIDSATQVTLSANSSSTGSGSIRFGVVDGATMGAAGGSQVHTLTTPQMPAHTHSFTAVISTGQGGSSIGASTATSGTTGSTGGGQAHPNVPPSIVRNVIIKL